MNISLFSVVEFFYSFVYYFLCRVADMSDEVHRLRPARFIQADGILRPYVFREAEGNQILKVIITSLSVTIQWIASWCCGNRHWHGDKRWTGSKPTGVLSMAQRFSFTREQ